MRLASLHWCVQSQATTGKLSLIEDQGPTDHVLEWDLNHNLDYLGLAEKQL